MNPNIIPLGDRVLIEPLADQDTMYGNIIIPDMGKERPELGKVVAVGSGRVSEFSNAFVRTNLRVGQTVLVPKIGTIKVEIKGQEYYIVQEKEVLAIYVTYKEDSTDE